MSWSNAAWGIGSVGGQSEIWGSRPRSFPTLLAKMVYSINGLAWKEFDVFQSHKKVGTLVNGVTLLYCGCVFCIILPAIYPTKWTASCLLFVSAFMSMGNNPIQGNNELFVTGEWFSSQACPVGCLVPMVREEDEPWMRLFWSTKARVGSVSGVRTLAFDTQIGLHRWTDLDKSRDMQ